MSECPNCGSAEITFRYGKARWICGSHGHGADYFPHQTAICELIRSLREELAEANAECAQLQKQRDDAFQIIELAKDLAAVERDAERDQIADWHENEYEELARDSQCIEHDTGAICDGCSGCLNHVRAMSHLQAAQVLRNKEHRSNA